MEVLTLSDIFSPNDSELIKSLRTARIMADLGHPIDLIIESTFIPIQFKKLVRESLNYDQNFPLLPANILAVDKNKTDWLKKVDRSSWNYWPELRLFLLNQKNWDLSALRSLDDHTDKTLRLLGCPQEKSFDIRGLVLGYVQSGKTANYSALCAKAADAGYRLIIVLSGRDNGLRRQTNIRLKNELVGFSDNRKSAIRMHALGKQWHEFTRTDLHGDFQVGFANHAALQGSQPVLLVIKKWGAVLNRLVVWLDKAPSELLKNIPLLMIDDEADLASVDTQGSYQIEEDYTPEDYELPSVTNRIIRAILGKFEKKSYVAYTATPYANVLIPHDQHDPVLGLDLYPKDFIIDLPKPRGYFGAEEIFGRFDVDTGGIEGGMNVIRDVLEDGIIALENKVMPAVFENALLDFILAGAIRSFRGDSASPCTMLIHTSQKVLIHSGLNSLVSEKFSELKDMWRYDRKKSIEQMLKDRYESDFRPLTRKRNLNNDVDFSMIIPHIGPFLEAVQVKEINSENGDVLDYEKEPSLKAIAIGGNKLSRGLTLEGLLVSFFIRRSATYDTLMQMGRWFGFRAGYDDLTRIYTTPELRGWFADLAFVEHRLREDIHLCESQGLTPLEVGPRIWQHPALQVTSILKRRFSSSTVIAESFAMKLEQTFKFPLDKPHELAIQSESNFLSIKELVTKLGSCDIKNSDPKGPIWVGKDSSLIVDFLKKFRLDEVDRNISLSRICDYIEKLNKKGELVSWTVAVRGLIDKDEKLGVVDWGLSTGPINQISRSRIKGTNSLGVITNGEDELVALSDIMQKKAKAIVEDCKAKGLKKSINNAARELRSPTEGLILFYPISKNSGYDLTPQDGRGPLYDNPNIPIAKDIVGMGISFPKSNLPSTHEQYLEGTVGWSRNE